MERKVKTYDLHDPKQIEDEKEYWLSKTPKERLVAAESLRKQFMQLKGIDAEQRLQRVLKITEQ
jgi:hypothetical protein